MLEAEVLRLSIQILKRVYKQWVKIERKNVVRFQNPAGQWIQIGKKGESDIGGWILKGTYIAKPLAIETKRSDFRPTNLYGKDKQHFQEQCDYIREINRQGGIGFWINDPSLLYSILTPVLMDGARVFLDNSNFVVVEKTSTNFVLEG